MSEDLTIEEFQEYFLSIINSLGGKAEIQNLGRKKIIINNCRSFDLKNLYNSIIVNDYGLDSILDRLKEIVEQIIKEEYDSLSYDEVKKRIIPRLFNNNKELDQNYEICKVPYVNDVSITFMIDFDSYTSSVSEEMMKSWGANRSELLKISKKNINEKFISDPKEYTELNVGLILKPDWLASSYLLSHNLLNFYKKVKFSSRRESEIVAFIPNRDTLILTEFKNRNIVKNHLQIKGVSELYPISMKPFVVSMDGVSGL